MAENDPAILRELGGKRLTSLDRKGIKEIVYSMGMNTLFRIGRDTGNIIPPMI